MKRLSFCALILALLSVPAFAAKNSQIVTFSDAVTVGSTQLPAGEYKVTWDGIGSNVQVTLAETGKLHPTTVTTTAKVTEQKNGHGGFRLNNKDGVKTLQALQFNKFDVDLTATTARGE